MKILDLIWGKVSSTIATVALAVFGLVGAPGKPWNWEQALTDSRPWEWIFALGAFLVLHSWVSWGREQKRYQRKLDSRETIQGSILHLILDLAGLAGRQYDLWIIDVYWKKNVRTFSKKWPFVKKVILEREASLSLAEVTKLPSIIELDGDLFGQCFRSVKDGVWWDPEIATAGMEVTTGVEDLAGSVEQDLPESCGVVKVWPIADRRRRKCHGLLVVHAKRDVEIATKVLGVLAATGADVYLERASGDIFEHLNG